MFISFFLFFFYLREPVARGCEESEKGKGGGGRGPIKIQMSLTVGVIPFCHDLHLEPSPKARHSALAPEIKADSDLMRKREPFTRLSSERGPRDFARNMKDCSANH